LEIAAAAHRRRRYGISEAEYQELLEKQAGVCAICGREEAATYRGKIKRLAVDHDHETEEIRGLLCSNCNRMIGLAAEDPAVLQNAIRYLE
jgi:hypothetical protein